MIAFNRPYFTGREVNYISQALASGRISGNGLFTKKCQDFFEVRYDFRKVFLTTSCTSALELAAILLDIHEDDEVIAPAYTFVSTVNPFVLRGAKIVFADSGDINPNIDVEKIEQLITPKTKAIVAVHYAGIACDMDKIMRLSEKYNLFVIEDAAHALDSYYKNKPLGSIGHLTAFSFHETKNVTSGEGGMLVINDEQFIKRAEIVIEKGTNKTQFLNGEVSYYEWTDIGSSFLPSDIMAAFLYAQLENLEMIQRTRKMIWQQYCDALQSLQNKGVRFPIIPEYATNNAHIFYLVCNSFQERTDLIRTLKGEGIQAVFHYLSLHKSHYFQSRQGGGIDLVQAERYANCLVRLPLYFELTSEQITYICNTILAFYA